ncbi:MAG: hypothetical protein ACI4F2_03010 [Acutalibacteraceae bacterium]
MKKSRTSLFRTLILSLVLLVTIFVLAVAWFTGMSDEATASGISVKAVSGLGLECSFDNNEYSPEIKREITSNFKFPLITGDGTNFFIPALDRSSGTPLTYSASDSSNDNPEGSWKEKRPAIATRYGSTTEGDYYVEDIWFQSDKKLDVYLTSQSSIKPLELGKESSELVRKSQYGDFTKDFIAGAARVAFFNFNEDATLKNEPEFVWVPNEKYHLMTSENMTPIPDHTTGSGQSTFDPTNPNKTFGIMSNDGSVNSNFEESNLFLWEAQVSNASGANNKPIDRQKVRMYKDKTKGTYLAAIDISSTTTVDHGILIHDGDTVSMPDENFTINGSKDNTECSARIDNIWVGAYFDNKTRYVTIADGSKDKELSQLTVNIGDGDKEEFFGTNTKFQILIEYSGSSSNISGAYTPIRVVGYVYYNGNEVKVSDTSTWTYNGTAGIGPGDQIEPGYVIDYNEENGSTILIANNTSSLAETAFGLNVVETTTNAVKLTMKQNEGGVLVPQSPLPTQLFTVVPVKDKAKTYKFKSISNGGFLDISRSSVILSAGGSEFTIGGTKDTGPILQSGVHYLKYSNGEFIVSNSSDNCGIQVYQGSSFGFKQDSSVLEDNYTYYIAKNTSLSSFGKATKTSSGYLLTSDLTADPETAKPVVTLQKKGDGNYKAHIRVKIWVEGTDREAKIPLAGGKFSTHLAFQGVVKETTPTT